MSAPKARLWLTAFLSLATLVFGPFAIIVSSRPLHWWPMDPSDARAAFEPIIPVLMGQIALAYRWYARSGRLDQQSDVRLPSLVVAGPPLAFTALMVALILVMMYYRPTASGSTVIDAATFKYLVIFLVGFLNATTFAITMAYFESNGTKPPPSSTAESGAPA